MVRAVATAQTDNDEALAVDAAADLLNVDNRYLVTLLDTGVIPFTGKGSHRRISRLDLIAYKRMRDTERRAALKELTKISEEAGLYDADYRSLLPDVS